jgi:hypothetical protein|tara:strand:+ start:38 stop:424 length:387 start_codon:yes stop_codon:yes gene_type:complete
MKYLWILLLSIPLLGQEIHKDGEKVTTFTQEEALEMIKQRDAQWEGKIEKADSLISSQKVLMADYEGLVGTLEEQAKLDSLLLNAKDKQIDLLHDRDKMNEKMVQLVKPKWYENQYLWLVIGFVFGKL